MLLGACDSVNSSGFCGASPGGETTGADSTSSRTESVGQGRDPAA